METKRKLSILLVFAMILQILTPAKLVFAEKLDQGVSIKEEIAGEQSVKPGDDELGDDGELENEVGNESGNEVGNESGNEVGNESGNEVGNESGNEVGNESGNEVGNESGNEVENEVEDEKGFVIKLDEIKTPEGNIITEENPINMDDKISVHYSWYLKNNHGYKANDKVEFRLPKGLKVYKEQSGQLKDTEGNVFASYDIGKDGKVEFIFTEQIELLSEINGEFNIESLIDENNAEIEDEKLIIKPHDEEGKIEIPINSDQVKGSISKKGIPNPDYNSKEIKWIIEVDTQKSTHSNGLITDTLPEGLIYKEGSIKGAAEPEIDGRDLNINLGRFKGKKRIELVTIIEDGYQDQSSFKNEVKYHSENTQKIEASSTVSFDRVKPLKKKAGIYNPKEKTIDWEVELNYDGKVVENTTLVDEWEKGLMELVDGSIEIDEVTQSQWEEDKIAELKDSNDSGFILHFPKIDKAYKIKYKTRLKDKSLGGRLVSNSIKWNGSSTGDSIYIGDFVANKFHGTPNYKDKIVKWTVRINEDMQEMNNIIISDEFTSKGLSLIEDDEFKVIIGSKKLEKGKDYKLVKGDNKFELEFLGEYTKIKEVIHIEYNTKFDYTKIEDGNLFMNKLQVNWIDEDGDNQSKELIRPFKPDDFTVNDGNKFGYYDAREKKITWNIAVNYQQNSYEDLVVKDKINGNHKLISNSIKVFEGDIQGINSMQKGNPVTNFKDNSRDNSIDISMGKTDKPYVIEYKTDLNGFHIIDKTYKNTAEVFDGEIKKQTKLEAIVGIANAGKYGIKTVEQDGDKLDWTIVVNPQQASIDDTKLVDKITHQEFLPETVKLYKTKVDNYGNISKEEITKYESLKFNEELNEMTLGLGNINRPYILEYSTLYFQDVGKSVSNDYRLIGTGINNEEEKGESVEYTIKQISGGNASGKAGALKVIKLDSQDEKTLKGAKFEIRDIKTGKVLKTGVTNDDGIIDFGKLKYGEYHLVETEAPEGFALNSQPIKIVINEEYTGQEDSIIVEKIFNKRLNKNLKIIKYGKDKTEKLNGSEFIIRRDSDEQEVVKQDLVIKDNGEILIEELDVGRYFLEESKAPEGYLKLPGKIYFEIKDDKTETLEIEVFNVKEENGVQLQKKDAVTDMPLEGVEFELWKMRFNDKGEAEKVKNIGTYTTNETGHIGISDLEDGHYQLFESRPLEGYRPYSGEELGFKIDPNINQNYSFVIKNKKDDTSQKLIKVDKDDKNKRLAGARFELYDEKGNLVTNGNLSYFETDKNGEIEFKDLEDGDYTFKEIKAPAGYKINEKEFSFTVGDGKADPIIVENELVLVDIKLKKVNKMNGAILSGASFTISYFEDGEYKVIAEDLGVDDKGELIIKDLQEGTYLIEETKAPNGYQKLPEPLKITLSQYDRKVIEIMVPNAPLGHAQIMKLSKTSKMPIKDVKFKLERQEKNGEWIFQEEITTGIRGYASSDRLNVGKYRFIEIEAPEGVIVDNEPIYFKVDKENFVKDDLSFTVENEYGTRIKLIKKDKSGNTLEGAEFSLYKGEQLQEYDLRTDQNGEIIVGVKEPGQYYFKETKAPDGYKLNPEKQYITAEAEKTSIIEMINEKEPIEKGKLEIEKIDKDTREKLAGAEFTVKDSSGKLVGKIVTDKNGHGSIDLAYGKYLVEETKAPEGYIKSFESQEVDINKNSKLITIKVENQKQLIPGKGRLEIKKIDKDTREKLAGAEFTVKDSSGKLVGKIVTDKNGHGSIDLAYGKYLVEETKAPEGYKINSQTYQVNIGQDQSLVELKIENQKKTEPPTPPTPPIYPEPEEEEGSLEIEKVDKDTGEKLSGAEFTIKNKNGSVVGKIVTDRNGRGRLDLAYGKYLVEETRAPEGYIKSFESQEVDINKNSKLITIKVENQKQLIPGKGRLEIEKIDKDTREKLAGAEFTVKDSSGKLVGKIVTDRNGRGRLDLAYGKYLLEETRAPEGYIKSDKIINLALDRDNKLKIETIENTKKKLPESKGILELIKLDKDTKERLAGAEFIVKDSKGKLVGKIVTGEDGTGRLELDYGKYSIEEVKAPNGYIKLLGKLEVEIGESNKLLVKTIYNNKNLKPEDKPHIDPPTDPTDPNYPSYPSYPSYPTYPNNGGISGGSNLPATGSGQHIAYILLGTMILSLGLYLNKKKQKS